MRGLISEICARLFKSKINNKASNQTLNLKKNNKQISQIVIKLNCCSFRLLVRTTSVGIILFQISPALASVHDINFLDIGQCEEIVSDKSNTWYLIKNG